MPSTDLKHSARSLTADPEAGVTTPPSALFTDLYELTMAQVYYEQGQTGEAVFELSVRSLPPGWRYLIAAGLERTLEFLESARFTTKDLNYLASLTQFNSDFLERLRGFRFSGDVWAVPEGTAIYPHEPLIQVVAPLPEGQIVETAVMNQMAFATLVASKAARTVDAAAGRPLLEFGGRRAHGANAALEAARAAYLVGFAATSSVEAGRRYGIPVIGTMAHSYILIHDDETDAFRQFASRYEGTTLLVDTYDTAQGVDRVIAVANELGPQSVGAIRIDSGDLAAASMDARRRLDAAGLEHIQIVASGGLDEHQVAALVAAGAPIDAFACGTAIVTGGDHGALDAAYKLVEYEGIPVAKRSPGKPSLGGRKQVWRSATADRIEPHGSPGPRGTESILLPVLEKGQRITEPEPLETIRKRATAERTAAHDTRTVEISPSISQGR